MSSQVVYSWPSYRKRLALDVSVAVDGHAIPVRWVDPSHRRVAVSSAVSSWSSVDLTLTLSTPDQVPEGLDLSQVTAHALLTASASVSRIPVGLSRSGDEWHGLLRLSRDEVRGTGSLVGFLTIDDGSLLGRVVGETDPWTVVFDPAPGPIGKGLSPLDIQWTSFSTPAKGMPTLLPELKSSISFCDTSKADPVLYLNEDVSGLREILDNEKATGLAGVTRDTLGALIALDAVAALVDAAVGAVVSGCEEDEDGNAVFGGIDNPVHDAVLSELVDHADFAVSYHDLCTQIVNAFNADDQNEMLLLSSRLRACAQGIVSARKHTEDLAKKVLDV